MASPLRRAAATLGEHRLLNHRRSVAEIRLHRTTLHSHLAHPDSHSRPEPRFYPVPPLIGLFYKLR